jgi:glyceraldehyde-3-phosphate dehydrogenase/erythrose-4-phosphate dehydrogenase
MAIRNAINGFGRIGRLGRLVLAVMAEQWLVGTEYVV